MIASLGYSVLLLVLLIMFRIQYFFEKTRPKMKKYASFRGRRSSWGLPANRLWTLKLRFGIFPFFTSSETIIRNKTKSFNIPYPTANNTPNYTMFPSYQTVPLANASKEESSSPPVPRMKKVAVAAMVGTAFVLGFSASGGALEGGANLSVLDPPGGTQTEGQVCFGGLTVHGLCVDGLYCYIRGTTTVDNVNPGGAFCCPEGLAPTDHHSCGDRPAPGPAPGSTLRRVDVPHI